MGGLSELLDVARRAMMSQRIGMDVTSHNIANASTPGYSRQRADFVATMPMQTSFGMLGTGVTVQHIGRIRDSFIDQQVRISNDAFGKGSNQFQTLSQIEALFNEPSDSGLAATMTNFFKSFQDLAVHPEESSTRNAVLQQGVLLVQSFHGLNSRITEIRDGLVDDVNTKVSRINTLAGELSALDINITNDIAIGVDPSDLKDQRDLKLDELSQLVNINVSEDKSGSIMVSVGGTLIASRAGAVPLKTIMAGNQINVVSSLSGLQLNVTGGQLGGALNMYNTTLPGYIGQLDQLASALITSVNTVHAGGFGLGTPPSTGVNFFVGTDSRSLGVDPAVLADINKIAASSTGAPGDNQTALAIAKIIGNSQGALGGTTLAQFYGSIVSGIGTSINSADNTVRSQQLILDQMENQRNSVSGVSLDEEMTNLIKYQRAFEASARLVKTTDELFQTVINMVG